MADGEVITQEQVVCAEEARGKGTILEPYGGPRFVLTAVGFTVLCFLVVLNLLLTLIGKPVISVDPMFSGLVVLMVTTYFGNRAIEKLKT